MGVELPLYSADDQEHAHPFKSVTIGDAVKKVCNLPSIPESSCL